MLTISKKEIEGFNPCSDGLERYIKQTNNSEELINIIDLITKECAIDCATEVI